MSQKYCATWTSADGGPPKETPVQDGQKDGTAADGTGSVFRSKVSRPLIVQRLEKHRYGEIGEVYRAPPTDEQDTQMARRWYEFGEGVA